MESLDELVQELRSALAAAPKPDQTAADAVRARAEAVLRPPGALAALDDVAVFLAGWQGSVTPNITQPVAVIFAADHGVAEDGVSAYPAGVTAAMVAAIEQGRASINALANAAGATVQIVDVGVGQPTANLRTDPAMTPDEFAAAFDVGRTTIANLCALGSEAPDLLIVGEVGIGNTTAAATVTAAILGGDIAPYVGGGTGVPSDARSTKVAVVTEAVERIRAADPGHALEILRHGGGRELVAMAGAMVEARLRSLPILLDGYITSSAALAIHEVDPDFSAHLIGGTRSAEPGHVGILDRLDLRPLIDLGLRLGEGSGAMVALPLLAMACRAVTEVATFDEWFGAE